MNVEALTGSKHVVAQDAKLFSHADGSANAGASQRILHAHIDIAFIGSDCRSSDHHAFHHTVRITLQNAAIHKGTRVSLVTVANDVFLVINLPASKLPLQPCGESTAATSTQTSFLIELTEFFRAVFLVSITSSKIAAVTNVFIHILRIQKSAFFERSTFLTRVEGDIRHAPAVSAIGRIDVEQTIYRLALHDGLIHDLFGIFGLHMGIENAIRLDSDQRANLTKTLATASGDQDVVVVIFMSLQLD